MHRKREASPSLLNEDFHLTYQRRPFSDVAVSPVVQPVATVPVSPVLAEAAMSLYESDDGEIAIIAEYSYKDKRPVGNSTAKTTPAVPSSLTMESARIPEQSTTTPVPRARWVGGSGNLNNASKEPDVSSSSSTGYVSNPTWLQDPAPNQEEQNIRPLSAPRLTIRRNNSFSSVSSGSLDSYRSDELAGDQVVDVLEIDSTSVKNENESCNFAGQKVPEWYAESTEQERSEANKCAQQQNSELEHHSDVQMEEVTQLSANETPSSIVSKETSGLKNPGPILIRKAPPERESLIEHPQKMPRASESTSRRNPSVSFSASNGPQLTVSDSQQESRFEHAHQHSNSRPSTSTGDKEGGREKGHQKDKESADGGSRTKSRTESESQKEGSKEKESELLKKKGRESGKEKEKEKEKEREQSREGERESRRDKEREEPRKVNDRESRTERDPRDDNEWEDGKEKESEKRREPPKEGRNSSVSYTQGRSRQSHQQNRTGYYYHAAPHFRNSQNNHPGPSSRQSYDTRNESTKHTDDRVDRFNEHEPSTSKRPSGSRRGDFSPKRSRWDNAGPGRDHCRNLNDNRPSTTDTHFSHQHTSNESHNFAYSSDTRANYSHPRAFGNILNVNNVLFNLLLRCPVRGCPEFGRNFRSRDVARQHLLRSHNKKYCYVCFELITNANAEHQKHYLSAHAHCPDEKAHCTFCNAPFKYDGMYHHLSRMHFIPLEGKPSMKNGYNARTTNKIKTENTKIKQTIIKVKPAGGFKKWTKAMMTSRRKPERSCSSSTNSYPQHNGYSSYRSPNNNYNSSARYASGSPPGETTRQPPFRQEGSYRQAHHRGQENTRSPPRREQPKPHHRDHDNDIEDNLAHGPRNLTGYKIPRIPPNK